MIRTRLPRAIRSRAGFTLVELLVVIGIMSFLATFLIVGLWPSVDKAKIKGTEALIKSIQSALDQYYAEFHDYPPDGYDVEPGWTHATGGNPGVVLKCGPTATPYTFYGSGCLIYFLCHPITNVTIVGADSVVDPRNIRNVPCNKGTAYLELKREFYSTGVHDGAFDPAISPGCTGWVAGWEKCEIIDTYGWPLCYDKVGDGSSGAANSKFQPTRFQGSPSPAIHSDLTYHQQHVMQIAHNPADQDVAPPGVGPAFPGTGTTSMNHIDPRGFNPTDWTALPAPKPRNINGYDLWSPGRVWWHPFSNVNNWTNR